MQTVALRIDGIAISVTEGTTILAAANTAGIRIPTLCYLENQSIKAACRICMVAVEGAGMLQPACATAVTDGMQVLTDTPAIRQARKENLQLLLSHHAIDCQSCVRLGNSFHEDMDEKLCAMCFYCDCVKDGDCTLQKLAQEYNVNGLAYPWTEKERKLDRSTRSITRDPGKCILCRRCIGACGEIQGIHAWSFTGRGWDSAVLPAGGGTLADSPCVECGQCVRSCPVGALSERQNLDDLPDAIAAHGRRVIVRLEPYFLNAYLEHAGQDTAYTQAHFAAALRRLGADTVVGNAAAERQTADGLADELERCLDRGAPLISATCPAAVRFLHTRFPELRSCLSTVPAAQAAFGQWANAQWPGEAYTVSLTPCSAKKCGEGEVDLVMSPREIHRLFSRSGVDLTHLAPTPLDEPGDNISAIPANRQPGITKKRCNWRGREITVALVCGLQAADQLLTQVRSGSCDCHYIQLLACPDGCISAGDLLYEQI